MMLRFRHCSRPDRLQHRFFRQLTFQHASDPAWIRVLQLCWQGRIRPPLVADRANEFVDRPGADAGEVAVARSGVMTAVMHRVADFDPGRESIEDQTADLRLERGNKTAVGGEIFRGAMNGGGE